MKTKGITIKSKKDYVSGIITKEYFFDELIKKNGMWSDTGNRFKFTWIKNNESDKIYALVKISSALYLFKKIEFLEKNETQEFQPYAQQFGANHQKVGSIIFECRNKEWNLLDIGLTRWEGDMMRFMLAKNPEYAIVFDFQNGRDFVLSNGVMVDEEDIEIFDTDVPDVENPFICKFCGVKHQSIVSPCPSCGAP